MAKARDIAEQIAEKDARSLAPAEARPGREEKEAPGRRAAPGRPDAPHQLFLPGNPPDDQRAVTPSEEREGESTMVSVDLQGKTALITGGTKGIGLASALALAEAGAQVFLTYKWGSADLDEGGGGVRQRAAPCARCSSKRTPLRRRTPCTLMDELSASAEKIDIFISNVSFALRTLTLADYKKRSLFKTLEYSTWPLIDYTRRIKEKFGSYPKYVLAISSDGPDHFYPGLRLRCRLEGPPGVLFAVPFRSPPRRGIACQRPAVRHREHRFFPGDLRRGVFPVHGPPGNLPRA